eukprot:CAMPEP_0202373756 /NCGR_PEP_ID=MMETSP1127-20130417/4718_1 /ASSEMBLY_ACC=CAM_ASM_000462 /TAXON_ID=3047 /ORGANISM="Dunaliella tertiolecta, Strain CCMP1320" /LENGTH=570 /DNA_ID=CAMNT_0048970731 /DNA_START=48 /DNA_END=1757 /DNA_ORIENTATION=+
MAEEDDELVWGDEPASLESTKPASAPKHEEVIAELEKQLHSVRKELAAKTVQLKKQEGLLSAAKQREAAAEEAARQQQQAQASAAPSVSAADVEEQIRQGLEAAAAATAEKEAQVQRLGMQVANMEESLHCKEEELEGLRRTAAQQKRALAEALAAVAEHKAAQQASEEASQAMASAVAEEELEALQGELVKARARAELEAHNREVELAGLRQEVQEADAKLEAAVAHAQASLNATWQAEMERAQAEAEEKRQELESNILQLRSQLQEKQQAPDSMALTSQLALLNNAKVQVQREYDAFRSQATQAARNNREEIAGLLAENADLKTRIARKAAETVMGAENVAARAPLGSGKEGYDFESSFGQPPLIGRSYSAYAFKAFEAYLPGLLVRLEHQKKGMVPCLVLAGLFSLILMISVVRAAASARSAHAGPLCVLSKLGINVGPAGCGGRVASEEANKRFAELLDNPARVHDVEGSFYQGGGKTRDSAAIAEANAAGSNALVESNIPGATQEAASKQVVANSGGSGPAPASPGDLSEATGTSKSPESGGGAAAQARQKEGQQPQPQQQQLSG